MENRTRIDLPVAVRRPPAAFVCGAAASREGDDRVLGERRIAARACAPERRPGPRPRLPFFFFGRRSYRCRDGLDVGAAPERQRTAEQLEPACPDGIS